MKPFYDRSMFTGLVVLVVPGSCVKLVSTFSTDFPFISIPPVYCALSGHTINLTCSFLASNAEKLSRIEWHLNNSLVHSWTLSEKSYFAGAWNLDSAAQDDKVFVHDESGASWGHSSVRVSHFDSSSNVTCAAFASSKVFRATVKFCELSLYFPPNATVNVGIVNICIHVGFYFLTPFGQSDILK